MEDWLIRMFRAEGDPNLSRVEWVGDYQLSSQSVPDLARIVSAGGAHLVQRTAPDGGEVFLSVAAITGIRAADPHQEAPGARAVITVAGHMQAVMESQADVLKAISA